MSIEPPARSPGEQWAEVDGLHIEVRGLAPPGPFVKIIKLIESLDGSMAVIVHHDRDPVPLYAVLAQRGWLTERIECGVGEVRLRLTKDS